MIARSRRVSIPTAWLIAGLTVALSTAAPAQTTQPNGARLSASTQSSSIEQQPLRRSDPARARPRDSRNTLTLPQGGFDVPRVLLALAIVIGLIILLRVLARWLIPGAAAPRSSGAVRLLSRSAIAPKQQILLVQVGRRILVVGDSGPHMSPLAEMNDPEEVASLVAQIESEKSSARRPFGPLFGRARERFDESTTPRHGMEVEDKAPTEAQAGNPPAPSDLGFAEAREQLGGLIDRVRVLAQQFRKS